MPGGEKQATSFLNNLFPELSGNRLLLWEKTGKRSTWFDNVDKAAKFAAGKTDIYFGLGLSPKDFGPTKRCPAAKVSAIGGLWLDVDFKIGSNHKSTELPELDDQSVDEFFRSTFPFLPTFANFSGGGFHLYWKFKELWIFENQADRLKASQLSSDFQIHFRDVLQTQKGWRLDNTSDLARVLRVPGTFNGKGDKLVDVEAIGDDSKLFFASHSDSFISPEDIEDFLLDASADNSFDFGANAAPAKEPTVPDKQEDKKTSPPVAQTPETTKLEEIKDVLPISKRCKFVAHCVKDAATLPEPHWYALATICVRCGNGKKKFHQWSKKYPKYSESEADAKLDQALKSSGPMTCEYIQRNYGKIYCEKCSFIDVVRSPISTALFPDELPKIIVDPNAIIPMSKFTALCRIEPRLQDSYDRKRADLKDSRACALSVASFCFSAGWSAQEVVDVLVNFHLEAKEEIKSEEYYSRIIALARKGKKRQESAETIEAAIDLGESATNEELRDALSVQFGFKITRFVKFMSEPPVFRLETAIGNVGLGENVMNQSYVRSKIYADLNVVIPRFQAAVYDRIVETLAVLRVEEYVGEEATIAGAVKVWVKQYLERRPPTDDLGDAQRERSTFIKDNQTFFFGPKFVRFLYTEFNEKISRKDMGIFLRQSGFEAEKIRVDGKVCHVWRVPEKIITEMKGS